MVNTDSEEYAKLANAYGAVTPFIRPAELATDASPIWKTIDYTFRYFEQRRERFDLFALVQGTSPFTQSEDIDQGVDLLARDAATKSVLSVAEVDVPPVWCNTLDSTLSMKNFLSKEIRQKNRQELPTYYRVTGAVRIARWEQFQKNSYDWYFEDSKALILDRGRSLDIDTEEDFEYAEFIMGRRKAAVG